MSIERNWHENFIKYINFITKHPNYKDLAINKTETSYGWVTTKQSDIGQKRIEWAKKKAKELNIQEEPGFYRKVMFEVHPTKMKVCQICGKEMSLDYIYLNSSFIKLIYKTYKIELNQLNSIYDFINILKKRNITEKEIITFLIKVFNLNVKENSLQKIIIHCIKESRDGNSKYLGPGAMSNFPDRFDGFHTYNRCCRSNEDTGRSKENLYSYGKDRRAYEYWSDGNIHAANQFMHSKFFKNASADHVGPISLGFIHDPRTLRKMSNSDNSSKRDRLLYQDIVTLEEIEELNDICVINWYSDIIWDYIKCHLNETADLEMFRTMLKTNMAFFMEILWIIKTECGNSGEKFLIENFLKPKFGYFQYDYEFNDLGQIVNQKPRNITDASRKEFNRYVRIALSSVDDYHKKENRKNNIKISKDDMKEINKICFYIKHNFNYKFIMKKLRKLISNIEMQIIH